jgi:hypothetical protein
MSCFHSSSLNLVTSSTARSLTPLEFSCTARRLQPACNICCLSEKIFSSKFTRSMRFGTMTVHPTDGDNLYSIESGTPPSLSTHHYHNPVTIHLHSLTSVHIHQQSDDVTPLNNTTINFDSATTNNEQDPRKPASGSPNGELPENPGNPPLNSKAPLSSVGGCYGRFPPTWRDRRLEWAHRSR